MPDGPAMDPAGFWLLCCNPTPGLNDGGTVKLVAPLRGRPAHLELPDGAVLEPSGQLDAQLLRCVGTLVGADARAGRWRLL